MTTAVKRFTKKELLKYNGAYGKPAYVALKGTVYDVSKSNLWVNGKHLGGHNAGEDLTERIANAPHSYQTLSKFDVVGELTEAQTLSQRAIEKLIGLHMHPISSHFPIAFTLMAPLFAVLYILTNQISYEVSSYYMLLLGFISSPVAAVSGFLSWKVTYEGRSTRIFRRKLVLSAALIILIAVCFASRFFNPNILVAKDYYSYSYLLITVSIAPTVIALGYYGGKIVH